jgi:LPXTG-motif cell wall-anchored protein
MRNRIIAIVVIVALVLGLVVLSSTAARGDEVCVPKAAYTETINHPEVSHVVHHPAVTETKTVADRRHSWNPKGPQNETDGPGPDSTPLTDPDHWTANTAHYNGTDPLGVVFQEGRGNGGDNASWFFWTTKTETVTVKEPYDEKVVDKEAYTETIEHPAVTCPPPGGGGEEEYTPDYKEVVVKHCTYDTYKEYERLEIRTPNGDGSATVEFTPWEFTGSYNVKHANTCATDKPEKPHDGVDKPGKRVVDSRPEKPVAVPTAVAAGVGELPNTGNSNGNLLLGTLGVLMIAAGASLMLRKRV